MGSSEMNRKQLTLPLISADTDNKAAENYLEKRPIPLKGEKN